jgi:cell division protein FtsB
MSPRRLPIVLLGSLLASAYFVHHAVFGSHGLIAKDRLVSRSSVLEREIGVLDVWRGRLRRDVELLRVEPPAPDLVEELARGTLGLLRPGDRIVQRRSREFAAGQP